MLEPKPRRPAKDPTPSRPTAAIRRGGRLTRNDGVSLRRYPRGGGRFFFVSALGRIAGRSSVVVDFFDVMADARARLEAGCVLFVLDRPGPDGLPEACAVAARAWGYGRAEAVYLNPGGSGAVGYVDPVVAVGRRGALARASRIVAAWGDASSAALSFHDLWAEGRPVGAMALGPRGEPVKPADAPTPGAGPVPFLDDFGGARGGA